MSVSSGAMKLSAEKFSSRESNFTI